MSTSFWTKYFKLIKKYICYIIITYIEMCGKGDIYGKKSDLDSA